MSPTSSSATCAASSSRAASRASCTRSAASASSCNPDAAMRSLRARLTLWITLVLAAVLALAVLLAARDVDDSERAALDDRLVKTAQLSGQNALEAVQQQLPSADTRLDAVLTATQTSLRLTLGDTTLVETGDPTPPHG